MCRLRRQELRQALRPVHMRRLQIVLQAIGSAEPVVLVPRQPKLPDRPAPPEPVPTLSTTKVPQDGNATRSCATRSSSAVATAGPAVRPVHDTKRGRRHRLQRALVP
uniref:(northern house mosquito) hypothetical protein n=1 Tax=Culex pipiens TaxID=7175 RepID=A0A8D7ZSK0_CULPI